MSIKEALTVAQFKLRVASELQSLIDLAVDYDDVDHHNHELGLVEDDLARLRNDYIFSAIEALDPKN